MVPVVCPKCGKAYSNREKACPHCGAENKYYSSSGGYDAELDTPGIERSGAERKNAFARLSSLFSNKRAHEGRTSAPGRARLLSAPVIAGAAAVILSAVLLITRKPGCAQRMTELELGDAYDVMNVLIEPKGRSSWKLKDGGGSFVPADPGDTEVTFVSNRGRELSFTYAVADTQTPDADIPSEYSFTAGDKFALDSLPDGYLTAGELISRGIANGITDNDSLFRVTYSGSVDCNKAGSYPVTVTVADRSGNSADFGSTVTVNKPVLRFPGSGSAELALENCTARFTFMRFDPRIEKLHGTVDTIPFIAVEGSHVSYFMFEIVNTGNTDISQDDLKNTVFCKTAGDELRTFSVFCSDDLSREFTVAPGGSVRLYFAAKYADASPNLYYFLETPDTIFVLQEE